MSDDRPKLAGAHRAVFWFGLGWYPAWVVVWLAAVPIFVEDARPHPLAKLALVALPLLGLAAGWWAWNEAWRLQMSKLFVAFAFLVAVAGTLFAPLAIVNALRIGFLKTSAADFNP